MIEFKRNFETGEVEVWENGKKTGKITEMAIPQKPEAEPETEDKDKEKKSDE